MRLVTERRIRWIKVKCLCCLFQMIQNFKVEYNHKKLDYVMSPMYMPNGPLKFKLTDRE